MRYDRLSTPTLQDGALVALAWLWVACSNATPPATGAAADTTTATADQTASGADQGTSATDANAADGQASVADGTADASSDAEVASGDVGGAQDAELPPSGDSGAEAKDATADADTADVPPAPPIPLAEFASATAAAICSANFTTCSPADKMPFATQAGCVAATTATNASTFASLATLVASAKLVYDGAAAAACLALAVEHCDELDFVDGPPVCQTVFKGKAPDGAACGFNVECASNYCFFKENCPGVCKKRVPLGSTCGDDDKCVAGALCFGGVCVVDQLKDVGAACDPVKCKPGLYCNGKEKCAPLNALGAKCDLFGSCVAGTQCIDAGTGGVCKNMPKKGELCTPDPFSDASTQCAAGLVCVNDGGDSGQCEPQVPIGGTCANSTQCGGWDVHCIGPSGKATCQLLSGKGGPCQPAKLDLGEWSGCLEPWTCSGGICIDVPGLGQTCSDDLLKSCADDLMCDLLTNKCIAMPGLGEKCYGVCKAGLDCDLTKTPNVCKPLICK